MLRMRFIVGCFTLFVIQSLQAVEVKVFTEILPPYQYNDSSNKPTGYAVDLVNAVLKQADLKSEIRVLPWVRAYNHALNDKNVLLFSVMRSEEREKLFKWIGEIDQLDYALYGLSNRSDIKISSLVQAKKYSIGTVRASHGENIFKQLGFLDIRNNNNYGRLLDMLHSNRFDLLLAAKAPIEEVIKKSKHDRKNVNVFYNAKTLNQSLYMVLGHNSDDKLVDRLQIAYKQIVDSGKKDELMKAWLNK